MIRSLVRGLPVYSDADLCITPWERRCACCGGTIPFYVTHYEVYKASMIGIAFLEDIDVQCCDCTEDMRTHVTIN